MRFEVRSKGRLIELITHDRLVVDRLGGKGAETSVVTIDPAKARGRAKLIDWFNAVSQEVLTPERYGSLEHETRRVDPISEALLNLGRS